MSDEFLKAALGYAKAGWAVAAVDHAAVDRPAAQKDVSFLLLFGYGAKSFGLNRISPLPVVPHL